MSSLWPHGDPRDVARAIETDPRYEVHAAARQPQASWLNVVLEWIARTVRAMLHGIDRALGAHNPFEAAIGFGVIAAGLGLLAFGSYLLVRSYLRAPRRRPRAAQAPRVAADERGALALRAAALAAGVAGRYREAAALLFLSAARALDERGRVAYDPARTPGEYRRLVREPLFDVLASDAVVALFAAAEPSAELFARMSGTYDRLFEMPAR